MYNKISIITPCYNEQEVIEETYKRLKKVLISLSSLASEIIFVNDGSNDRTAEILQQLSEKDSCVKLISFSKNFGHQAAVTAGINYCTSDLAVIIDADLQDPPEVIPDMIKILQENQANVVFCVRKSRKGDGFIKKITAKLFYRILNYLADVKLPVDTGDFRLIDHKVIKEFNKLHEKGKYIRGLVSWVGYNQVPFYYEREERFAGETKYPFAKMLNFATTSMLYFSKKPLKIATTLGFSAVFFSVVLVIWFILGKLLGFTHANVGWTSLAVLITFFGGIQLLTIGIVGAYIGRLFDEVKDRPEYIVDYTINI